MRGRGAGEHSIAIIGAGVGANKVIVRVEHVERFVIGVGPYTHFRVVVKIVVLKAVAVISTGRIRGGGDSDELQGRRCRNRELAEYPALCSLVVENDGIAIVVILAPATESRPKSVPGGGADNQGPGTLVENRKRGIHPLHILRSAHRALGIGGCARNGEPVLSCPQTFKTESGRRSKGPRRYCSLPNRIFRQGD